MSEQQGSLMIVPTGGDVAKYQYDGEEGGGLGTKFGMNDMLLPLFKVLSQSDDEIAKPDKRVKGAEPGMFYDASTGRIYDGTKGVYMVLSHILHKWSEWKPQEPRNDGSTGQLIEGRTKGASFDPEDEMVIKALTTTNTLKKQKDERGNPKRAWNDIRHPVTDNDLIETYYVYGLLVNPANLNDYTPVVMIFFRSKLPAFRDYYGKLGRYRTPSGKAPRVYYHTVKMTSAYKENAQGKPYYVINVQPSAGAGDFDKSLLPPDSRLAAESKEFHKKIEAGLFRLDESIEAAAASASVASEASHSIPGGAPEGDFFGGEEQ